MANISVLMPTYNRQAFISRAIESLLKQEYSRWELIVIDDGSTDDTGQLVKRYQADSRIRYLRLKQNRGLGAALNIGLRQARGAFIGYLPTDDVYYRHHLETLAEVVERPEVVLAYSGIRYRYNRVAEARVPGFPLQLVQVLHRKVEARWVERAELVTDDLERMYWSRLKNLGEFRGTGTITAEWVDHPGQRHKLIREPLGGINPYRVAFSINQPLRFHSSIGNPIDEIKLYQRFRTTKLSTRTKPQGLKILLVGELAYNPERMLALSERGHQLYGLWMRQPYWYNTVGPLPFGQIQDIDTHDWQNQVAAIQPDIVYALLNWQAVPFVKSVLPALHNLPVVWHFKEGPFICLEKGIWPDLMEIYKRADGWIFVSPEMREWFRFMEPLGGWRKLSLILDGDLPKKEWFGDRLTRRLSAEDGEIHTVVPGRPIGLHPETVHALAREKIHLHLYGTFVQDQWRDWIQTTVKLAPHYFHVHETVDQTEWVKEFSRYDAGWLHYFESRNGGDYQRADWDDLNIPARMATLACAGLPLLQRNNEGHVVATQSLATQFNIGVFFRTMPELGQLFKQKSQVEQIRHQVWQHRWEFCFDHHVDRLIGFFKEVVKEYQTTHDG